jgi:hypothetical protein
VLLFAFAARFPHAMPLQSSGEAARKMSCRFPSIADMHVAADTSLLIRAMGLVILFGSGRRDKNLDYVVRRLIF